MKNGTTIDFYNLVRDGQVHHRVYSDPEIFEAEMERVFGRSWIFVAHESEVPAPGDFKTDRIGRRPVILIRGMDGELRLFFNVCRHRGATVCHEASGNARTLRCMYHGWTYDSAGRLDGVPLLDHMRDFDPAENGLVPAGRLAIHRGFIFATLAEDGPSLAEHLGEVAPQLDLMVDRAPAGAIRALRPIKYSYDGNWKFQIENYAENYHPNFLHQAALTGGRQALGAGSGTRRLKEHTYRVFERAYPHGHHSADFRGVRDPTWLDAYEDPSYLDALTARDGRERAEMLRGLDVHLAIYPNLLIHTRMNHFRVIRPIAVDRTEVYAFPCLLLGASDAVNARLTANTSEHCSAAGRVQVDDMQAFNWAQQGVASHSVEWFNLKLDGEQVTRRPDGIVEWYGASEEALRNQYRNWVQLMR